MHLVTVNESGAAVTEVERDLRQRLHQLVPRDGDGQGRRVLVDVLEGPDVAEALLQAAQRLDADVLCVGTHGRTGGKTAMGSVARTLTARADRPVLVVRPIEG